MVLGKNIWVIPDGYMNDTKNGNFESHEAVCVLNLGDKEANIKIDIYFEDREPLCGFTAVCKPNRSNHIRFDWIKNDKGDTVPKNTPYSVVVTSDVPIVAQHSRMDVSQAEMTLMTTIPY